MVNASVGKLKDGQRSRVHLVNGNVIVANTSRQAVHAKIVMQAPPVIVGYVLK